MSIKPRHLEATAIIVGALYSIVLGVLSGLNLFGGLPCHLQGAAGLASAIAVGVLTYPVAARHGEAPWLRGALVYSLMTLISVLAFWPVVHTVVLVATAPAG